MAKAKKKRTKKYRPRALKLPPMVLDCWDPLSDKDRADLDLAGFLPLAADYLKKGRKVDAWMLEPAQAALEVVADMEAQCTRRELGENIQETIRHVDKICRFDPEALWTVAPDYARNAQTDKPEPVKAVEGRRALTFMHGSPVIGYVVDDEERGRVIWREPKTETNLPITGPVLCLLESPDEEPWAWRKTNS